MKAIRTVAPFVLGLACGAGAVVAWGAAQAPARAESVESASSEDAPASSDCVQGLDASTLRRVLRQELAALTPTAAPATGAAPDAPEPAEEDPETAAEYDATFVEVTARLDDAFYEGVWDEDDAMFLRPRLARLRPSDREEVLARLVPALNSGEIDQRVDGIPF